MKPIDELTQYDQHQLLVAAAEEIEIDWPRFFDWKSIVAVKEVSIVFFLLAALVGFAILSWEGLGYILHAVYFQAPR